MKATSSCCSDHPDHPGSPEQNGHGAEHDHDHGHDHDHDHDHDHGHSHGAAEFSLKREGSLLALVIALFILGSVFKAQLHNTPLALGEYAVFIPAYLISGWSVLISAGRNLLKGRVFDENFLMTIATVGAIAIHQLPEAVGVMLFFKVGELFQELAVNRSRRSIQSLLEIRPDFANLKTDQGIQIVSPQVVNVGDTILVKPGEKIPLDGNILDGSSQVDTS
ncbi:MAG: heavy metal translocating P-type ATPase, partial [Kovacikia sp.]